MSATCPNTRVQYSLWRTRTQRATLATSLYTALSLGEGVRRAEARVSTGMDAVFGALVRLLPSSAGFFSRGYGDLDSFASLNQEVTSRPSTELSPSALRAS